MAQFYLVTGGCGFIGSHLLEALIARGDRARVLDDLSTGSVENLPAGVELLRADVADAETVRAAMQGVDGCFHLAAIASVERSTTDWVRTHRTNLSGTIAVLDSAKRTSRHTPIPVVYASSAAVYGNSSELPLRETLCPQPRSPYGADKYGSELHARIASEVHKIPTLGLRFFNVYGPRQDPRSPYSGVISIFCDRLLRKQAIDIYGDGSQTRDFVFVKDVVAALLAAMNRASDYSGVLNVCSATATSVLQLAKLIADLCGLQPEVLFQEARVSEIGHSYGDRSLACARLALSDPVDLRSGLAATLAWLGHDPTTKQGVFAGLKRPPIAADGVAIHSAPLKVLHPPV
jgi:UDP-glucose 4-epimerase